MKKNNLSALIVLIIFISAISCNSPSGSQEGSQKAESISMQTAALYVCPMDTDIQSNKPGTCPKCGMDLEKKN